MDACFGFLHDEKLIVPALLEGVVVAEGHSGSVVLGSACGHDAGTSLMLDNNAIPKRMACQCCRIVGMLLGGASRASSRYRFLLPPHRAVL